jgi:hypothetical protein
MSCQVHEIDLFDFLREPRAAEFRAFRHHYPLCAECAAEIRAWTELHEGLRAAASHPAPAELLAFADASLAEPRRDALARHVESCVTCRDELSALGSFAAAAEPAVLDLTPPLWSRVGERLRSWLWQPALGYALALLLLVPLVADRWSELSNAALEAPPAPAPPAESKAHEPQARAEATRPDEPPPREAARPAPQVKLRAKKELADQPGAPPSGAFSDREVAQDEKAGTAKADRPSAASGLYKRTRAPRAFESDALEGAEERGFAAAGRAGSQFRLVARHEGGNVLVDVPNPARASRFAAVLHLDERRTLTQQVDVGEGPTTVLLLPSSWFPGRGMYRLQIMVGGESVENYVIHLD